MNKWVFVLLCGLVSGCATPPSKRQDPASYGKYVGTVETRWLDDGRKMELLKPLTFIDPNNVEWLAPAGAIVDGASIPQVAWSVTGGPFEGKYRNASVIHDVACDEKHRTWESVHKVFYNAMRASSVEGLKARIMYAAVYYFGPRWDIQSTVILTKSAEPTTPFAVKMAMDVEGTSRVDILTSEPVEGHPDQIKVTTFIHAPAKPLKEKDFPKLIAAITVREASKEGPMSLEEIRTYYLNNH